MPSEAIEGQTAIAPPALQERSHAAAMWCHLAAFAEILIFIPFANIIGPLVVWLSMREKDPEVDQNGKEAVNFQITMTGAVMAIWFVSFILSMMSLALPKSMAWLMLVVAVIETIAYLAAVVVWLTFVITATIRAANGQPYRYPLSLRLIP